MVKKLLNRLLSSSHLIKEKCFIDAKTRIPKGSEEYMRLRGWYHDNKGTRAPRLLAIPSGGNPHPIKLNIPRPDVQKAFNPTSYLNGFDFIISIPTGVENLNILNARTDKILASINVSDAPLLDNGQEMINSNRWVQKIPTDIKDKLLKKFRFEVNEIGTDTNYETILGLLRYLARPSSHQNGYNVFSYVSGAFGGGEAGRTFIDYLAGRGDDIRVFDYFVQNHPVISEIEESTYIQYYFQPFDCKTNIFLMDVHSALRIKDSIPEIFKNKKNITWFWWEFETGFEDKMPTLNAFDEVIVFSDFIYATLDSIPTRQFKLTKLKYPFREKWNLQLDKQSTLKKYNLRNNFHFFFNFDFHSSYNRKNPLAILKAFKKAFKPDENVTLLFKTNSEIHHNEKYTEFNHSIEKYDLKDRTFLMNDTLTKDEFMSLLNQMNCYISLHRGEGLGLGILEAMALNKPVIATNYGGNTEYMQNPLAHPVKYTLVDCNDDFPAYKNVKKWADPDTDHAAYLMRQVYEENKSKC